MRNITYAAGSIVEAVEERQLPHSVSIQPTKMVTVRAVNPYGMVLVTQHYGNVSAEWQREEYRLRGYKDII